MSTEESTTIGTITFLVNEEAGERLTEAEMEEVGAAVAEAYAASIERNGYAGILTIQAVAVARGCITIAITVGAVIAAAATTAKIAIAFLKDYEDIRNGAVMVAQDINGLAIKLKEWKRGRRIWIFRTLEDRPPPASQDKPQTPGKD